MYLLTLIGFVACAVLGKVSGHAFQIKLDKKRDMNVSEAVIAHGKMAKLRCARDVDGKGNDEIILLKATYTVNYTTGSLPLAQCPDLPLLTTLELACNEKSFCTITAADPSTKPGCQKRAMKIKYSCGNKFVRMLKEHKATCSVQTMCGPGKLNPCPKPCKCINFEHERKRGRCFGLAS